MDTWTVTYDGDHASWYASDPWWKQVTVASVPQTGSSAAIGPAVVDACREIEDVDVVDVAAVEAAIAEDDATA